MAYAGIDCASKLDAAHIQGLKSEGITHIGRYLSDNWKGLTKDEVQAISDAGLNIVSIFESNPTKSSYFTADQGRADAQAASKYANDLGQPHGTAIYFAVDYDAQGKDLGAILDYFNALADNLKDYKLGAYGSYAVLSYLKQHSRVEFYYQTYAWSHDQVCDFTNFYQHQNEVQVAGLWVDLDKVLKDPGSWSIFQSKVVPKATKVQANGTYTIKQGDTFWDLEKKHNWPTGSLQDLNPKLDPKKLQIGQVIKTPGKVNSPVSNKYHTVKKDENLSVIAADNGLTLVQIEKLNPQIKDPDVIHPGDNVRVK
ncbi:DUF1906 domain-containing protein [Pullulanibacillus sp. KACC 23026]|uniref:glycoside hydrolase domain-containing protein n=1 Tax=Pullulanibacillus sp. KACC 23026 TaxID=3028315 RepID=UPI0023AF25D2|nr:glycoside hydrolase domain-containing protein [Pullulanibacillus sp. KACC 23026]WEG14014.1 DUF1906 domain-containing protein [Pullulanibacillus sp. KACC 23026]